MLVDVKKPQRKEHQKPVALKGEALYLALRKQWYNARTLRRDFGRKAKNG